MLDAVLTELPQGWNAIKSRVEQLGLTMTDDQVKTL